ncbi:MAG: fibronectin-binding autotransporter adhesin [Verrucomicrobiota bacterium]
MAIGTAQAAQKTWNNTGTNFNAAGSWTPSGAPGTGDVGLFNTTPTNQPNVTSSLTIAGLLFTSAGSSGYDLTSSSTATVLGLNGTSTSGSNGSSTGTAAAIRNDNTSGTETVDAPISLAASTGISTMFQDANDGSTIVLNGVISETGGARSLSLKNGTFQLNNANTYTGGTSIDAAGTNLIVGNDTALGTGTFTNNSASTFQAGTGARTLANDVVLAGNMTINGGFAVRFNGSFTSSGSSSRTLTVSNTGGATLAGNIFLQEAAASGRTFIVNGSSAVNMTGVVANGGVGSAGLRYSGTDVLTLSNSNTYSGGTSITVAGGTIVAAKDGALGSGNISLTTTASVTLTLQGGATNNYIADSANLSLITGNTVNLNFTGTPDTIAQLIVNGSSAAAGTYGAGDFPELFGTGQLTVLGIPEPATWMLMGVGLLLGAQRLRRKS